MERQLEEFGGSIGSGRLEVLRQGYELISSGLSRISIDPMPYEKAHVALLKGAVSRMEKALWPNPLLRFFVRLKWELIDRPKQIKAFKEMKGLNEKELKKFLTEKG